MGKSNNPGQKLCPHTIRVIVNGKARKAKCCLPFNHEEAHTIEESDINILIEQGALRLTRSSR